jgi:septum formation protein
MMDSDSQFKSKWILASASPRRKELLRTLIQNFEVVPADMDEIIDPHWDPQKVAINLAIQKSLAVSQQYTDAIIIGADTVVRIDHHIYGKPQDEAEAYQMLKSLSGRVHNVETGVGISLNSEIRYQFTETTQVFFKALSEDDITHYIASQEPFGKAGSYAIQGLGATFIEKINGCFYNVVGLPIFKLNKTLEFHKYERNRKSNALG